MLSRYNAHVRLVLHFAIVGIGVALFMATATAWAGHRVFQNRSVGGISISVDGVVGQQDIESRNMLRTELLTDFRKVPADLNQPTEIRMISLRGLHAAIEDALANNLGQLPDEVRYLAGMQRIQYVFVDPLQNDIVLAGPAEGWRIDATGNVVGLTTGRPVIQLDDLLVAFRSVRAARTEGISCSIDPTPEGRLALESYLKRVKTFSPAVLDGMAKAMGPQKITVTGIPTDSHFARVLVACDYKMKRIAMNLEPSPVAGLPGFLDLLRQKRVRLDNMMPRWWLACNYEPLARSADGLSWQLRGPGVKALTEDDFIAATGDVKSSGRKNPVAEQWADQMTEKYEELCQKEAVFGELRNLMDMCVIAALIDKEDLMAKAGCSLPLLSGWENDLRTVSWHAPKQVDTQCSFIRAGSQYIITASGGVQIESWEVASRSEQNDGVGQVRERAVAKAHSQWWWN